MANLGVSTISGDLGFQAKGLLASKQPRGLGKADFPGVSLVNVGGSRSSPLAPTES